MKKRLLALFSLFILFFTACNQQQEKPLHIATNSWIGYAPLFYAKEKGYLGELNIKLITNVSLAEAADVYDIGKAEMVTTTQHEYYSLKNSGHKIVPVILFDRSNGGDLILSNKSLEELKSAKKIFAYLEIDSINAEILKDFIKHYNIDEKKITFINKDQAQIEEIEPLKSENMLIVTYVPYNLKLQKKGFKEVASTKNMNTIMVIDALCANKNIITQEAKRLQKLKHIIDRSIDELTADKKSSYKLIKSYLGNMSYNDYVESFQLIKWINKPSPQLLKRIEPMGYKKEDLIQ
ncbi:ABC transporter substrate-binding protein [Sulfurimonas paralvinellae]|uniref:SsuA/THI5-like domain-containing protein n=1 Tax=Sulfurimonas paralvinellae TaxID=317658 RepID=A0A7M1B8B0_9BACT|nr:ABC transporter substrate-binding protein [Sulfurimonas paralvinellae]QOP45915.1 hypothetical protein FM071_06265 [Sulfurimonas paralvinellae]